MRPSSRSSSSSSSPSRPRALLFLCPLFLAVLLVVLNACEARNLRSARLSTAAAASLFGMPLSADPRRSGSSTGSESSNTKKPAPTLLFTLQSDSAFLQLGDAGDPDPDLGTLTLEGVAPTAVWFSERPDRRAGALPTATLASAALDIVVDDDGEDEERQIDASSSSSPSSDKEEAPRRATWLGVPNLALTGTAEGGDTATAVLTVLGRPSYDEKTRMMTADVRVVPMRSLPSQQGGEDQPAVAVAATTTKAAAGTAAAAAVPQPPPHSPLSSSSSPRSLSLSRAALLIDQLPISDGYIGNQYGFANDCLSTMSPSCNAFSGTGFYRPGFVGWLGGQMGPGNTPRYPPGTRQQPGSYQPPQQAGWPNSPSPPPPPSSPSPPPPPPAGASSSSSGTNSGGQAYLMSQPYDPSKGR